MKRTNLVVSCAAVAMTVASACSVFEDPIIDHSGAGGDGGSSGTGGAQIGEGGIAAQGGSQDIDASSGATDGSTPSNTGGKASGSGGKGTGSATGTGGAAATGPFWIETTDKGCERQRPPTTADRPTASDPGADLPPITFAMSRIRNGASANDDAISPDPNAWQETGFDLDGVCTNSSTCEVNEERVLDVACKNDFGPPFDGKECRDNEIGKLFQTAQTSPLVGELFGLTDKDWNCEIYRGGFSTVLKVSNYNGKLNDRDVRLDMYVSPGLQTLPGWTCRAKIELPLDPDWYKHAPWRSDAHWKVTDTSIDLAAPPTTTELPNAKTADPTAFVRNGYLVAQLPDGREFQWDGQNTPVPGFRDVMHRPLMVAKLIKDPDTLLWSMDEGTLTWIVLPDEMLRGFREIGLCENMCNTFDTVKDYLNTHQDMLSSTTEPLPDVECNSLSLAVDFDARQATSSKADLVPGTTSVECPQPRHPKAPRQGCKCQPDGTTCIALDGGS
jgi:hypothetical protein